MSVTVDFSVHCVEGEIKKAKFQQQDPELSTGDHKHTAEPTHGLREGKESQSRLQHECVGLKLTLMSFDLGQNTLQQL